MNTLNLASYDYLREYITSKPHMNDPAISIRNNFTVIRDFIDNTKRTDRFPAEINEQEKYKLLLEMSKYLQNLYVVERDNSNYYCPHVNLLAHLSSKIVDGLGSFPLFSYICQYFVDFIRACCLHYFIATMDFSDMDLNLDDITPVYNKPLFNTQKLNELDMLCIKTLSDKQILAIDEFTQKSTTSRYISLNYPSVHGCLFLDTNDSDICELVGAKHLSKSKDKISGEIKEVSRSQCDKSVFFTYSPHPDIFTESSTVHADIDYPEVAISTVYAKSRIYRSFEVWLFTK